METGLIFNIQRYSVHDGPGIRTTVFLKGCPLGCRWCHNPEGADAEPVLSLLPGRCIGCGACVPVCPHGLGGRLGSAAEEQGARTVCEHCGACVEVCPSGARTLVGRHYTVDELLCEVGKDQVFYEESGGGVTFSGGEPVASESSAFLLACLKDCRESGFHTAVDTSGAVVQGTLLQVAALADLILYDLKLMDDALHREYVGAGNQLILENLQALSAAGSDIWIRVPLIPGITDGQENLEETAAFVASLPNRHPVHLLPYHKVGRDKYRRLGRVYPMADLETSTPDVLAEMARRVRAFDLEVQVGG